MQNLVQNPWLRLANPIQDAEWNLICFPYAGGTAEYFLPWRNLLPQHGLYPIQLPGRAARWQEAVIENIELLIKSMLPSITPILNQKPYIIFGHSMGGYIGYSLAKKIKALGLNPPTCLVVSATPAPKHWGTRKKVTDLSDKEFASFFQSLGGFHPEILKHQSFVDLQMRLLKQDVRLCESCQFEGHANLDHPILAISANDDPYVSSEEIQDWSLETNRDFFHQQMMGDHFYLTPNKAKLLALIQQVKRQISSTYYA